MRKPPPSGGFLFLRRLHLLAEVFWRVWICIRHADLSGFGQLADDDEEGEFVEKFDQSTASMTLEALIIA